MVDAENIGSIAILVFGIAALSWQLVSPPFVGEPDFFFVAPLDGQEISDGDSIILSVKNFLVQPPQEQNAPNEGHFHIYIDSSEAALMHMYDESAVIEELPLGEHIIRVGMHNNDHTALGIEKSVTVTVVAPEETSETSE